MEIKAFTNRSGFFLSLGVCAYLTAIFSLIVDGYFRFNDAYYLLKSIVLVTWVFIVISYSFYSNRRSRALWWLIPPGLICSWWLIKFVVVFVLWTISGFAP